MFRSVCLAIVCGLSVCGSVGNRLSAGEYNTVLNIGDKAPAWMALPGTDGRPHGMDDFRDKDLLVVIFTCNSCPVATDYEQRIIDFCGKYSGEKGKVGVVAINVNRVKADLLPAMTERAKAKKYPFPYLHDESQKIARDYGATFTPEFFLLNKERRVLYMGGMDDHSDSTLVKTPHLVRAVEAALKGEKPPVAETVAIGCRVRYAREKK